MLSAERVEAGDETFVSAAVLPTAAIGAPLASFFERMMRPANDNAVAVLPRIVGLTGYAGSGKSTVAEELAFHGYLPTKFAGPLKAMMRALYREAGVPARDIQRRIEGDLKQEPDPLLGNKTPRQAMQWLGTEWGRGSFGDNFWVDLWAAGLNDNVRYVVDDCRFQNEADAIRAMGGVIVEVRRPGVGPVNNHVSENLPAAPDIVINNDGSIADLRQRVARLAA